MAELEGSTPLRRTSRSVRSRPGRGLGTAPPRSDHARPLRARAERRPSTRAPRPRRAAAQRGSTSVRSPANAVARDDAPPTRAPRAPPRSRRAARRPRRASSARKSAPRRASTSTSARADAPSGGGSGALAVEEPGEVLAQRERDGRVARRGAAAARRAVLAVGADARAGPRRPRPTRQSASSSAGVVAGDARRQELALPRAGRRVEPLELPEDLGERRARRGAASPARRAASARGSGGRSAALTGSISRRSRPRVSRWMRASTLALAPVRRVRGPRRVRQERAAQDEPFELEPARARRRRRPARGRARRRGARRWSGRAAGSSRGRRRARPRRRPRGALRGERERGERREVATRRAGAAPRLEAAQARARRAARASPDPLRRDPPARLHQRHASRPAARAGELARATPPSGAASRAGEHARGRGARRAPRPRRAASGHTCAATSRDRRGVERADPARVRGGERAAHRDGPRAALLERRVVEVRPRAGRPGSRARAATARRCPPRRAGPRRPRSARGARAERRPRPSPRRGSRAASRATSGWSGDGDRPAGRVVLAGRPAPGTPRRGGPRRASARSAAAMRLPFHMRGMASARVAFQRQRTPNIGAWSAACASTSSSVAGVDELEDRLERERVLRPEREEHALVGRGGLQLEVERPAEALAEREPERAVRARAERRVDDELHPAGLVEEALGDEGVLRRERAERGAPRREVLDELARAGLGERALLREPGASPRRGRRGAASSSSRRADTSADSARAPARRLGVPERDSRAARRGRPRRGRCPLSTRRIRQEVVAEQEDVAGEALDREVLVHLADRPRPPARRRPRTAPCRGSRRRR